MRQNSSSPTSWSGGIAPAFRLYRRWRSRSGGGRPRVAEEVRGLIRRPAQGNSDWSSPKIHAELQKLSFVLSERTVARYFSPAAPPIFSLDFQVERAYTLDKVAQN